MFFRQDVGEKFMQFLDWKRGAGFPYKVQFITCFIARFEVCFL